MRISSILLKEHYRLLVLGGGTGGCAVASRFQRLLKESNQVAIVEPSKVHYYQPGFTLVGGGLMRLADVTRKEADVVPQNVDWIQKAVFEFHPNENRVQLSDESSVTYDFLVVALGLELRYDLINGLSEEMLLAHGGDESSICSIYGPRYVAGVWPAVERFAGGNAIFTLPSTPIKCAGAPQKIMYLVEEHLRKTGKRDKCRVLFNSAMGKAFSVEKYANALTQIMNQRNIEPHFLHNLVGVDVTARRAIFELLDANNQPTGEKREFEYSLLHVAPPCSPVRCQRETRAAGLTDASGWLAVDAKTLRSTAYTNVYAIGDCANVPTSKTMAAISSQLKALSTNLQASMEKKEPTAKYSGYTSCPLVVDSSSVVLAEFDGSTHIPMETFPYDQSQPSRFAFWLKRYLFPVLYWRFMVSGHWLGPERIAKFFRLFKAK